MRPLLSARAVAAPPTPNHTHSPAAHLGAGESLVLGHCIQCGRVAAPRRPQPLVVLLDAVGRLGAVGQHVQQHRVQLGVGRACGVRRQWWVVGLVVL